MLRSQPTMPIRYLSIIIYLSQVIIFELMFATNDNELREFAQKLINQRFQNSVIRTLEQEDQKQLRYVKLSMQEKMPKQLQSKKYQTLPGVVEQITNDIFPRMFDQKDKKAYEYINDNMENIRKIAETFMNFPKIDSLEEPFAVKVEGKKEENMKIEPQNIENNEQVKQQKQVREDAPVSQNSGPKEAEKQKISENRYAKSSKSRPVSSQVKPQPVDANISPFKLFEQSRVNPFIANNINFMDPNANSKALQSKHQHMQFSQNSRNIAAMSQASKFTAFSQNNSFPTSVMPGTILAPRETSYSKEAKLDIGDVMRYTLGVKKESQTKTKMQNPFHRPPKKRNE